MQAQSDIFEFFCLCSPFMRKNRAFLWKIHRFGYWVSKRKTRLPDIERRENFPKAKSLQGKSLRQEPRCIRGYYECFRQEPG